LVEEYGHVGFFGLIYSGSPLPPNSSEPILLTKYRPIFNTKWPEPWSAKRAGNLTQYPPTHRNIEIPPLSCPFSFSHLPYFSKIYPEGIFSPLTLLGSSTQGYSQSKMSKRNMRDAMNPLHPEAYGFSPKRPASRRPDPSSPPMRTIDLEGFWCRKGDRDYAAAAEATGTKKRPRRVLVRTGGKPHGVGRIGGLC
jgi:hypothetical protein